MFEGSCCMDMSSSPVLDHKVVVFSLSFLCNAIVDQVSIPG